MYVCMYVCNILYSIAKNICPLFLGQTLTMAYWIINIEKSPPHPRKPLI